MNGIEARSIAARTHGRVLVRAGAPDHAAALVGFHGYAEHAGVQMERLTALRGIDGWLLVSIQALNRFYRGRSEEVVAGWMTREDRLVAIADTIAYVDAAIAACVPERVDSLVLAGFSQGVATAFRVAVRGRRAVRAVIAVGGDVPPELLADPGPQFPPVLLVRGSRDDFYTGEKMTADVAALEARGTEVRAVTVDAAHEWTPPVADAVAGFLGSIGGRVR